jgi:hypothetical protein
MGALARLVRSRGAMVVVFVFFRIARAAELRATCEQNAGN